MIVKRPAATSDVEQYAKGCLKYALFGNIANAEYDFKKVKGGFLFVPVYPTTYIIDESFYNRLFTILNLALTPNYTLIRPLTMQVVEIPNASSADQEGFLFLQEKASPED